LTWLAGGALGGGNESRDDAGAHDRVILAERGFHADEIAVLHGTKGINIGELGFGDELDRLALVEAERGEALAQDHVSVISRVRFTGRNEGGAEPGGHVGKAVDAGDFLREIDVAGEILAERGDRPLTFGKLRQAEAGEDFLGGSGGDGIAEKVVEFC
jgi:hypothetical protein